MRAQVHSFFVITLILKGTNALLEITGGLLTLFISPRLLQSAVFRLTRAELVEDPRDFMANWLTATAAHFSAHAQVFVAWYLLGHGVIKLFLVIQLLRRKLWAYPLALAAFTLFIMYQLYRYALTHSPWLLLITVFDLVVLWLTWQEYRTKSPGPLPRADREAVAVRRS